jgi:excisionase family DNA binding protein
MRNVKRQTDSEETQWLSLGEAARRLDVHATTLRRWADEGQIPFMLTPGGHRRFAASDVEHTTERRHSVRGVGPVEKIWADHALKRARERLSAQRGQPWMARHNGAARDRGRKLGHELIELTMRYLTAQDEGIDIAVEAGTIGRRYGEHGQDVGLPLTEVLKVSMVFRDALVAAAIELPENVRIPRSSQTRFLGRINNLLNFVQLGVAGVYDNTPDASKIKYDDT